MQECIMRNEEMKVQCHNHTTLTGRTVIVGIVTNSS